MLNNYELQLQAEERASMALVPTAVNTYTLPVPLNDNTGRPFDQWAHETVSQAILAMAGGYRSHDANGNWQAPDGTLYPEPVRVYTFDIPATEHAGNVVALCKRIKRLLSQEAVYLHVVVANTYLV